MTTIWKFPFEIADLVTIEMPAHARILHVDVQAGQTGYVWPQACLWALVDPDAPTVTRRFQIIGTGHPVANVEALSFITTFQQPPLVWHVFEVIA